MWDAPCGKRLRPRAPGSARTRIWAPCCCLRRWRRCRAASRSAPGVQQVLAQLTPADSVGGVRRHPAGAAGRVGAGASHGRDRGGPAELAGRHARGERARLWWLANTSTGFATCLDQVLPWLLAGPGQGWSLTDTIVHTQLQLLSRYGDSLIARKCGPAVSAPGRRAGAHVLARGRAGGRRLRAGAGRPRLLAAQRSSSAQPGHDCRFDRRRVVRRPAGRLSCIPLSERDPRSMQESYSGATAERVPRVQRGALHHVRRATSANRCMATTTACGSRSKGRWTRIITWWTSSPCAMRCSRSPSTLDHHMLLPTSHPQIHVQASERGSGGHVRGSTVGVSAERVRPVAGGQHDGRAAGAAHRSAVAGRTAAPPGCSPARRAGGCRREPRPMGHLRAARRR